MNNNKNNLKRELGLTAATAIVVGNMIGSEFLLPPQTWASVSNPRTNYISLDYNWTCSLLLALCFAKLRN